MKVIYETDDGKQFDNEKLAKKHQEELDAIDYKSMYYELLEKYKDLKTTYDEKVRNNKYIDALKQRYPDVYWDKCNNQIYYLV